jgi:acyl-CoA thioesterase II
MRPSRILAVSGPPPQPASLADLLRLEPHGPDTFVGSNLTTPWGRVFGGQVFAQALRAAALTVDDAYLVHSARAYFIRGGELDEPIRFEVDRIRNGRSFVTRRVVARQSSGAILNLDASFQQPEVRAEVQVKFPPDVPPPAECEPISWSGLHDRRSALMDRGTGRFAVWQQVPGPDLDGAAYATCALAFVSDDVPMGAARTVHPVPPAPPPNPLIVMGASLDHAIWVHRPVPTGEWLLFDLYGQGWSGGRGLSFGHVFSSDGVHVASVAQEVLVREAPGVIPGAD